MASVFKDLGDVEYRFRQGFYFDKKKGFLANGRYLRGEFYEVFKNGKRHCSDGPSIIGPDGDCCYHLNGLYYEYEDWIRLVWEDLPLDKKKEFIWGNKI